MEGLLLFVFVIGIALVLRLVAGSMDTERIEAYVRDHGWELVDRSWDPLGPGWFGEKSDRIYKIVFRDEAGNTHRAHVKTSMFGGVYLTHDTIVEHAEPTVDTEARDLAAENAALRKRIAELEQSP